MDLRDWCLVLSVVAAGVLSLTPVTAGLRVNGYRQGFNNTSELGTLHVTVPNSSCKRAPPSNVPQCSVEFELVTQADYNKLSEHLHFQVKRVHGLESANQGLKQELQTLREDHLKAIAALHSQALSAEALAEIRQQVQSIVQQELERAR